MTDNQVNDLETLFSYFNELNIISQLSNTLFEKNLPTGLSSSQFSVLNWFIRVDNVATPGRLSTAFQVTKGAMTNTLKKLHDKKLITITPHPDSGRSKIVKITTKGRKVRDSAISGISPLLQEFSQKFSISDVRRQVKSLEKVRQYLDEYRYK
ncbi:MAG: DNA-binding MarR family transcriptional regulator [Candidatus Azotimanducaceae bacterium]|jgi:DNA-binding MarR family transcriptional regulator